MATTRYIDHRSSEGERWDQIADRYYGDPTLYGGIIAANPDVAIAPLLPSGLLMSIPVLEQADVEADISADLPPWKR